MKAGLLVVLAAVLAVLAAGGPFTQPWQARELAATTAPPAIKCGSLKPLDPGDFSQSVPICQACGALQLPAASNCSYDVSACTNVKPGMSCTVRCMSPFTGPTSIATCPAGNSNPGRHLLYSLQQCECAMPLAQEGYLLLPDGTWRCAQGYLGTPMVTCQTLPNCAGARSYLTGCEPLVPCALPTVDQCRFDVSACTSVQPGSTCLMKCKSPFVGDASVATCDATNTNPNRALHYFPLVCVLQDCPDPFPKPLGYVKNAMGIWQCDSGFHGTAVPSCAPGPNWAQDCSSVTVLSGCQEIVHCSAVTEQGTDPCMYDYSACSDVLPGASCEVRCKPPYSGKSFQAFCPAGNTQSGGLIMNKTICVIQSCGDPVIVPAGYLRTDGGGSGTKAKYECEQAYTGYAQEVCEITANCAATSVLMGCQQLVPCQASTTDCRYNMYNCKSVQPGSTCVVSCNVPFSGPQITATCPNGNTYKNGLQWSPPTCNVTNCADPNALEAGAMGYLKGANGWVCASGFSGIAKKSCIYQAASCTYTPQLSGCHKTVPCVTRNLTSAEECYFNLTSCKSVASGSSCFARCDANFTGMETTLTCPAGNTIPGTLLSGDYPSCDCGEPVLAMNGEQIYNRTDQLDVYGRVVYICASGYTGTAEKLCNLSPQGGCTIVATLSGCYSPRSCEAAGFFDDGLSTVSMISGTVKLGPALLGNEIDETGITGYSIFQMSQCGQIIGKEIGFAPVATNQVACCQPDAYQVRVRTPLLQGAVGLLIMAQTTTGMSKTGRAVSFSAGDLNRTALTSSAVGVRPFAQVATVTLVALTVADSVR